MDSDFEQLVSVVITTKNEAQNIANCLKSIQDQTWAAIEIIVVDNDSSDNTKQIAFEYTDKVFDYGPERSYQRNYGMLRVARGKFVMFVDADMILSTHLIERCVTQLSSSGAVALHIDEVVLGRSRLSRIRRFERSFYSGTVVDGARFFLKSVFEEVGGFDENLPPGPEDWDLDKRLKKCGPIVMLPNRGERNSAGLITVLKDLGLSGRSDFLGVFHNEAAQPLSKYLRKKAYYSGSMATYIDKWGRSDVDVVKQLGLWYRYLGVFLEDRKWIRLMKNPYISCQMFLLRTLVGLTYILNRKNR